MASPPSIASLNCQHCKIEKPIVEFVRRGDGRGTGYYRICLLCNRTRLNEKYRTDPIFRERIKVNRLRDRLRHPDTKKNRDLRYNFGITLDDYNRRLESQEFRCAVCQTQEPMGKHGSFNVDHDHVTGKVRGLLCTKCNFALGHLNDDPKLFRKAAEYLESFGAVEVKLQ